MYVHLTRLLSHSSFTVLKVFVKGIGEGTLFVRMIGSGKKQMGCENFLFVAMGFGFFLEQFRRA